MDHHVGQVRAWYAASEDEHAYWEDASFSTEKWLQLTPTELAELSREVVALFDHWAARTTSEDDVRRDPVLVFGYGVPAQP